MALKKRIYKKKARSQKKTALEHISTLFEKAKQVYGKNPGLANRYVTIARKTAMKFRIRLDSRYKRLFCKHCYKFVMPGQNLRVRTRKGKLVYYCLECKRFWRKPIGRKAIRKITKKHQ